MSEQPPPASAAEIEKGEIPFLLLNEREVVRLLAPEALLDGLVEGFKALSQGLVQTPARPEITVPGKGFSLAMAAWMPGANIAVKVVNVFESNLAIGLPNHLATIGLFDPDSGLPLALMDGTAITALRTAGSAAVSVRALARPGSRVATIIGAGVQGREHLRLLPLVCDFEELRIASLRFEDAVSLARRHPRARAVADVEAAVATSDVVCLASHAREPVIAASWLRPGTHVTSVGYAPPHGELPSELAGSHRLFVECPDAFEPPPVGCAELVGLDPARGTDLGDVLLGRKPGRVSAEQITVYKAMGIAMEDMVAAQLVYETARRAGVGRTTVL